MAAEVPAYRNENGTIRMLPDEPSKWVVKHESRDDKDRRVTRYVCEAYANIDWTAEEMANRIARALNAAPTPPAR